MHDLEPRVLLSRSPNASLKILVPLLYIPNTYSQTSQLFITSQQTCRNSKANMGNLPYAEKPIEYGGSNHLIVPYNICARAGHKVHKVNVHVFQQLAT